MSDPLIIWVVSVVLTDGSRIANSISWRSGVSKEEAIGEAVTYGMNKNPGYLVAIVTPSQIEVPASAFPQHLDMLERMAREHCSTSRVDRDYNGQVAGSLVTDSGARSADAAALESLAEVGRFHIVATDGGRMVVGYWPENLPGRVRKSG